MARDWFALDQGQIARALVLFGFCHVPVVALVGWMHDGSPAMAGGLSALVAILGAAALSGRPAGLDMLAASLAGQAALIVALMQGSPWQLDSHFYFFVLLTVLSALASVRVVLVAAGVTALHHLSLNFLVPELIYPGGADFSRLLLHAGMVVIETAALVATILNRQSLRASSRREAEAARAAQEETVRTQERAGIEREATMDVLEAEFTWMVDRGVEGDFSARVETSFDDRAMQKLAWGLNQLFDTLDGTIGALEAQFGALAQGDFSREVPETDEGRLRDCRVRMNQTTAALRDLVSVLGETAAHARSAAFAIREDARQLSEAAAQQAAGVSAAIGALEGIADSVRETADQMEEASGKAQVAMDGAREGEEAAEGAVRAVGRIEESSSRIAELMSLIEGIALQTNLLALNAGVEAARAGDAGKGFAVIAMEVRALSDRTRQAANEVTPLIRASTADVEEGVLRVRETVAALGRIAASVDELMDAFAMAAATSAGQVESAADVQNAVARIGRTAQDGAEAASRLAGASDGLGALVARLDEMIAGFRTDAGVARTRDAA
jgi:methyl-accepting chemotaxis protein